MTAAGQLTTEGRNMRPSAGRPRRAWPIRSLAGAVAGAAVLSTMAAVEPAFAAPSAGLSGASWIWFAEGDPRVSAPAGTRYLRRTFTVPVGRITEAALVITGDESVDVWLNGIPFAGSPRRARSWQQALLVDLTAAVRTGPNTLAVAGGNPVAGPAGVIARLRVSTPNGTVELVTDSGWRAATNVSVGWEQPTYDDTGWPAARDLGRYGVPPWGNRVRVPDARGAGTLSVGSATTERAVGPLGVDSPQPRFGWQLAASGGPVSQGGYQIVVRTGDEVVWDSGRVPSQRSVDVPYGGATLASLTRYHWRVRVWDAHGRRGGWSAEQFFETGLLDPDREWQADFVGQSVPPPALTGASWIWYPEGDPLAGVPPSTRYFRRTFDLTAVPASVLLAVTGDDTADVWVNGSQVSASPRVVDSWKQAQTADIAGQLRPGANTIAIASENTTQSPAAVIARLTAGGGTVLVTDGSWRASQTGPAGWQQPDFDDSGWAAARALTGYGSGPWGANVVVPRPAPVLRHAFTVPKPVVRARLLVTAQGLHETRLNGSRVGTEALAPGWTDYGKRLQYRVYDVTGQLRPGANVIGAYLGNGWFSGSVGFAGVARYGSQPWYSALLQITYADRTSTLVRTDDSWRVTDGPIRTDDLYHGEEYDARLGLAGFDRPGYDDSGWAPAAVKPGGPPTLVSAVDPGVRVQQELRPVQVGQPRPGVWVFDLGQNFTGWNRLRVRGPRGTTVTLRHAEVLNPDGTIYTANLRAARQTDRFTLAGTGAGEVYTPRFTVHGYRYVELTGFPGVPTADTITGLAAWTGGAPTGTFTTSNAMLNQLQHNILWGQRSNMLSVPTDCPQRDERLGWTGDIATFAGTATFNFDVARFLDKFADDLTDAQHADGAFTDVAPDVCCGAGTAGWGDAGVIVPYTLWQRYGDLRVVDEHFAAMVRWVDYLQATADSSLIRNRAGYGDWLNVDDPTAQDLIGTAYFAWSARLLSRMAAATGRTAAAASYGALADRVAAAFRGRFVGADGTVSGDSQTGYVLTLAFGLVDGSQAQAAADKLAAKVAATGGHLSVGFLGVENLLPVLAEHGHLDTAYQLLLQPGYPGWGYLVGHGATTIWERWDGIRTDGSLADPGLNSFNHYALGAVGDWLYRSVGGLAPAAPGYQRLSIAPRPGGGLTSARAALLTPYGQAVSDWSASAGTLTLRVTVPANTTATVRVPARSAAAVVGPAEAVPVGYTDGTAVFHLPAGSYTFTAGQ